MSSQAVHGIGRRKDEFQVPGLQTVAGKSIVARGKVGFCHEVHAQPDLKAPVGVGGIPTVELNVMKAVFREGKRRKNDIVSEFMNE